MLYEYIAGFAVISLVFIIVMNDSDEKTMTQTPVATALTVSEAIVTKTQWTEMIKATGPITARQEAIIGAEISGQRLVTVMADIGDIVKKGQNIPN